MADLWWLVAGRLKVGTGSREAEDWKGELLTLRIEDERLMSLFLGRAAGVWSGRIGVVEPVVDAALCPLAPGTAAEAGRDVGVLLDSRDVDTVLDRRRNQLRGRPLGVLARELSLPSGRNETSPLILPNPLPLTLALGSKLFWMTDFAFSEWERPNGGAGKVWSLSGVLKALSLIHI